MYEVRGSDLLRLGYVPDFYAKTKKSLLKNVETVKYYDDFYDDTLKKEYDLLIIGDSFSEGVHTFSNNLAKNNSVLIIHRKGEENPFQILVSLINSRFFDKLKVKNIILESVERLAVERAIYLNFTESLKPVKNNNIVKPSAQVFNKPISSNKPSLRFFSTQPLLFGYNTLKYFLLEDVEFNSTVNKYTLNKKLFTHFKPNTILVLKQDEQKLFYNNEFKRVQRFNNVLNILNKKLSKKDIKFHVMVCPDKYDLYFDYFSNSSQYTRPMFFRYLAKLNQTYHFVPIHQILKKRLDQNVKDLYLYDDTHWSSKSVDIVSRYLEENLDNK